MASLNRVMLMGNLTRDPELRYTPNGTPVCDFGLAVNRKFTKRDGGEVDETCFVDVTMWGKRGAALSEYLGKGDPVFLEGRLTYDSWEHEGQRRSKLKVTAESFEFIGGGKRREQGDVAMGGVPADAEGFDDVADVDADEIPF